MAKVESLEASLKEAKETASCRSAEEDARLRDLKKEKEKLLDLVMQRSKLVQARQRPRPPPLSLTPSPIAGKAKRGHLSQREAEGVGGCDAEDETEVRVRPLRFVLSPDFL